MTGRTGSSRKVAPLTADFQDISKNLTSLDHANVFAQPNKPVRKSSSLEVISELSSKRRVQVEKLNKSETNLKITSPKLAQKTKTAPKELAQLENVSSRGRVRRKAKEEENPLVKLMGKKDTERKSKKLLVCKCKFTKCIQRYCPCFRTDQLCGSRCKCQGCINRVEYLDTRNKFKQALGDKDELSFTKRFKVVKVKIIQENGEEIEDGKPEVIADRLINIKGCTCTKSKCLNNYCDCLKKGIDCTSLCVCTKCRNQKEQIIVPKKFENQKTNYKIYKKSSMMTREIKKELKKDMKKNIKMMLKKNLKKSENKEDSGSKKK